MTKYEYRYLTPEELYALEREAHQLRARVLADMLRSGASAIRSFFSVRPAKGMRHA